MQQGDLRSGHSYWRAIGPPPADYPLLDQDVTCDVVIIGGGITGALVSYQLVQAGVDAVVVDREQPGCGSTAASTGLLQYEVDTSLVELIQAVGEEHAVHAYRRGLAAIDELRTLAAEINQPCGFSRRTTLYLASSDRPGTLLTTYVAVSQPLDSFANWPDGCLIWESARPYFYARQTPDGRVVIGGEDSSGTFDHENDPLLATKAATLSHRFEAMFPTLKFHPVFIWGGTFAETSDGLPYIGLLPGRERTYFALGYGGNGITFSMIAARLLTDLCFAAARTPTRLFFALSGRFRCCDLGAFVTGICTASIGDSAGPAMTSPVA